MGNNKKDKSGFRQITFGLENEKKFNFSKINRDLFFTVKTKSIVYLRPFLSFLLFAIFQRQNFMYFGHKH